MNIDAGPAPLERADERCACSWAACKNTSNIRKKMALKLRVSTSQMCWFNRLAGGISEVGRYSVRVLCIAVQAWQPRQDSLPAEAMQLPM